MGGGCGGGVVGMEEEAVGVVLSDGGNTTNSRAVRACVFGHARPMSALIVVLVCSANPISVSFQLVFRATFYKNHW